MRKLDETIELPVPQEICEALAECNYCITTQMHKRIEFERGETELIFYHNWVTVNKSGRAVLEFTTADMDASTMLMMLHAAGIINLTSFPEFKTILQHAVQDLLFDNHSVYGPLNRGYNGAFFPRYDRSKVLEVGEPA